LEGFLFFHIENKKSLQLNCKVYNNDVRNAILKRQ